MLEPDLDPHVLVAVADDQHRIPLPGADHPHPLEQQAQPVFHFGHEGQVGQTPHQPADQAAQADAPQVGDRVERSDHSHRAEVGEAEGTPGRALNAGQDVGGDPAAHLHSWTGHARQRLAIGGVAVGAEITHHPHLGVAWNREVGLHDHAAALVDLATAACRQHLAQMGGPDTCSPADGGRLEPLLFPRALEGENDFGGADLLHPTAQHQLDTAALQIAPGGLRQRRMHGPQDPITRVDEQHPAVLRPQLLEVALDRVPHQVDQGTGQFTAGGASADHRNALQQLSALGIRGLLGLLECREHPPPDLVGVLENFHRRCHGPPLLVAEEAAARARRQDQVVVGITPFVEDDFLVVDIDLVNFAQQHLHVGCVADHLPQR